MRIGRICLLVGVSHAEPSSVTRDGGDVKHERKCKFTQACRLFANMQAHTNAQFNYFSGLANISSKTRHVHPVPQAVPHSMLPK